MNKQAAKKPIKVRIPVPTILRCLIVFWIIYCLIMASSYGGNLKSTMTKPMFTKAIETVQDVLESDLPCRMVSSIVVANQFGC